MVPSYTCLDPSFLAAPADSASRQEVLILIIKVLLTVYSRSPANNKQAIGDNHTQSKQSYN
jgi:hypothetical protein